MGESESYECGSCKSTSQVKLCKKCGGLSCQNCIVHKDIHETFCATCNIITHGTHCPTCGSQASVIKQSTVDFCPICGHDELDDPYHVLSELPREFFSELSSLSSTVQTLEKLYRGIENMISHVLYTRLAGMFGFPQIEKKLKFILVKLLELNDNALTHMNSLQKDTLTDLWAIDNFRNLTVDSYRMAVTKIANLKERITLFNSVVQNGMKIVQISLEDFLVDFSTLKFHRQHYDSLRKYLPVHERYVVAVLPNVAVTVKKPHKQQFIGDFVLGEEKLIILANGVGHPYKDGMIVPYTNIRIVDDKRSKISGAYLQLLGKNLELLMRGTPEELKNILEYLKMIFGDTEHHVGSIKEIKEISLSTPTTYVLNQQLTRFLSITSSRLFASEGDDAKRPPIKHILHELESLDLKQSQFNELVMKGAISADKYSAESYKIKFLREHYKSLLPEGFKKKRNVVNSPQTRRPESYPKVQPNTPSQSPAQPITQSTAQSIDEYLHIPSPKMPSFDDFDFFKSEFGNVDLGDEL